MARAFRNSTAVKGGSVNPAGGGVLTSERRRLSKGGSGNRRADLRSVARSGKTNRKLS